MKLCNFTIQVDFNYDNSLQETLQFLKFEHADFKHDNSLFKEVLA